MLHRCALGTSRGRGAGTGSKGTPSSAHWTEGKPGVLRRSQAAALQLWLQRQSRPLGPPAACGAFPGDKARASWAQKCRVASGPGWPVLLGRTELHQRTGGAASGHLCRVAVVLTGGGGPRSSRNLREMQSLGPHRRPSEPASLGWAQHRCFNQRPVILSHGQV